MISTKAVFRFPINLLGVAICGFVLGCSQVMSTTLPAQLAMHEMQDGFAGRQTTTIVVEPDGQFCYARKRDAGSSGGVQRGHLDKDRLLALGKAVSDLNAGSLSDSYGRPASVNSHQLTLIVDGRQSVFHLSPKLSGALSSNGDSSGEASRAIAIRQAMLDAVDGAPSEPSEDACVIPSSN